MASDTTKIVKTFLAAMRDSEKKRTAAYDTPAVVTRTEGQTAWVHIAGGVDETPVQMTMNARSGDTVLVRVSGGRAWLTGNATSPPTDDYRAIVAESTAQTAATVANTSKVAVEELSTTVAVIETTYITTAQVDTLLADYATIQTLEAEYATIENLDAATANISTLQTKVATIENAYISTAQVNTLLADYTKTTDLVATYATITNLNATNGNVTNLTSRVATIEGAYITTARVNTLLAEYTKTSTLEATYATITDLHTNYATISLSNVTTENVKNLLVSNGIIKSATIVDGHITGTLDAITVNGVNIIAGTVVADRLVIRGTTQSIVYALNNYGQISSTQTNTIDGYILTQRTVNANRIVANSITASEIAANTITANEIAAGAVTASKINVATISAISEDVGTIKAGDLRSFDYDYTSGSFSNVGMDISLNNKWIITPKFSVINGVLRATDGIFSGQITSESGKIGNWNISNYQISQTTGIDTSDTDPQTQYMAFMRSKDGGGTTPATGETYAFGALQRSYEDGTYGNWSSNFYVRYDGYLYATKGSIAGSLITRGIDASNITAGTISASVIAANSISVGKLTGSISNDNWVIDLDNGSLTIGNISADNINAGTLSAIAINNGNGTFSVTSAGALTASNATITGSVTANSGTIGGFSISSTSNTGTTASGGHHYTNSLYVHSTGTEGSTSYEYEAGLTGNNSSTAANFYVRRIASGAAWSTSELRFFVRNDGYIRAITGQIGPWYLNDTAIYRGGGYQSATAGSAYFGNSGLSVTDKFYVTDVGTVYIKGALHINDNGNTTSSSIQLARGFIDCSFSNGMNITSYDAGGLSVIADSGQLMLYGDTGIRILGTITENINIAGTLQTSGNINIVNSSATSVAVGAQNSVGKIQVYMAGNGNMGVYDATNSKYLIYKNSSGQTFMSFVVNDTTSSAGNMFMGSTGRVYYGGGSSKRYKKEIKPLADWKSVLDIPVVSFKYRDNYLSKEDQRYGVTVPGFIAEEVDEHYSVAADRVEGKVHDWNARYIIPPMLAVEQDHEKRIRELEDEIRRLKGEVA